MKIGKYLNIPIGLIALDTMGSILLLLGLLDWFAGVTVLPISWIGEQGGRTMTAIGAACLIMALIHYIRIVRIAAMSQQKDQDSED